MITKMNRKCDGYSLSHFIENVNFEWSSLRCWLLDIDIIVDECLKLIQLVQIEELIVVDKH